MKSQSIETIVVLPISIGLLSIAWSPKVRKLQIDHDLAYVWGDSSSESFDRNGKTRKNHLARHFQVDTTNEEINDGSQNFNIKTKNQKTFKNEAKKIIVQTNTSRGKATLINSLIKLISIPAFIVFFAYLFEVADVTKSYEGFVGIIPNSQLGYMFFVQIVSAFIGYHSAWIGCMITLQRMCFAIPLTLCTPLCIGIVLLKKCDFFSIGPCTTFTYNNSGQWVTALSVLLWLGQFFATTYYAWRSQDFIMADEATLFWLPCYDGKKYVLCFLIILSINTIISLTFILTTFLTTRNSAGTEYFVKQKK